MKFSLSLPPKPSATTRPRPKNFNQDQVELDRPKPEYVSEFDSGRIVAEKPEIAIPKLENTWRPEKKMKNIDPHHETSGPDLQFEVHNGAKDMDTDVVYGLNLRNKNGGVDKNIENLVRTEPSSLELQKFREDMNNLPDDRGMDEFVDIPVEGFGAALLAGYGWSEGKGIGRNAKEDVKVKQYVRRAGKEGLGFAPEMLEKKQKRRLKPGESKEEKPHLIAATGADGRARNAVDINEKLVLTEPRGFFVDKVVRIIGGRHMGLKGKVLEKLVASGSSLVVLKLLRSGEEVTVGEEEVAELGSVEEEKCLKKLKNLKLRGESCRVESYEWKDGKQGDDYGSAQTKLSNSASGTRRTDRRSRDERRDSSSKYEGKRNEGRESSTKGKSHRREGSDYEGKHDKPYKSSSKDGNGEVFRGKVSWLTRHIRVRIISKDFQGGKLYLKKGEVMDVVGRLTCDLTMDGSGELVQGVNQDILETALPKKGGPVLVLIGKHKGVFGKLVARDTEKETGMVQDADTHEILTVGLDQIAEYIGDPSHIGY